MDDECGNNDRLAEQHSLAGLEKAGGGAANTQRSYAAANDGYTMQNTGVRGASDSNGAEGEVGSELLEAINRLAKQKRHLEVIVLCDQVLESDPKNNTILEKKVRALCQRGKFRRAFRVASKWLQHSPDHPVAERELKRLKTVLEALEGHFSDGDDDEETEPSSAVADPPPAFKKVDNISKSVQRNIVRVLPPQPLNKLIKQNNATEEQKHLCSFCDLQFERQEELDTHCQSDLHKKRLASDESQEWKYRPPPRGQTAEDYVLCHRFYETQRCPYGDKCTQAHSEAELEEWRERFAFRKQQLQQAKDKFLHGNTFVDQLLEKLTHPDGPQARLVQNLDFVKIHVNSDLKVNMSTKKCTNAWTFTVTSKVCMHAVGLIDTAHRSYFHISSISVGPKKTQKYQNLENHCQEWVNQDTANKGQGEYVYRVKIVFKTEVYGTFRQQMTLGFGVDTVVVRDVQVESCPTTDPEKLTKDLEVTAAKRWSPDSVAMVPFYPEHTLQMDTEEQLQKKYVLPRPERLSLSETVMQNISKENYRLWMHEMLYLEEMAELGFVQRFNVTRPLQLVNRFLLMPGSLSQAKYSREGELFARLQLEDVLSEDSSAGRLILQNAQSAWVAPAPIAEVVDSKARIKVYECHIEEKGKNFVFLRLSAECVKDLSLTCDEEFQAQIQFQLNRLPKCEMHSAVDNLSTLSIVFPNTSSVDPLPPPPDKVLSKLEGVLLNDQQRQAILTITSHARRTHPPLLIIGPFGTGKTYTLAQAAKLVLEQDNTRILICTHSNSAADLYIKDFMHPYVAEGHSQARPLRVYYRHRWVNTVPEVILPYSLWSSELRMFLPPTIQDLARHRIIITTLSTARYISDIGLPKDFFSHIFIDEAAQALECETLIPMSLADENTRIVLAGDHMQISPEVYSDYTRQQGFHISFLERLFDLYPVGSPCMVMLCENYRSHKAIVDFTSDLFYENRLLASGKQCPHPTFYPLTFCHAKGLEEQHPNSTGFYNLSEVYEIVDRVDELRKKWPDDWGDIDNNGISVVAPYHDQVVRIRAELRKKKIHNVSVERVLNVQGKQFRVMIISAVRTRSTCRTDSSAEEEYLDYGFLSNVKLLNTAITRAQSLVMVVGDPLSLCLVGKCRKVWEYFLEVCDQNSSLFGITWAQLRSSLDRVEVAKNFVLNPLAPEFVPNRRFHFTFQVQEQAHEAGSSPVQRGGGPPLPYAVNPSYVPATLQPSPYQMYYPPMMPYYNMPIYSPYMAPLYMRAPRGSGLQFGHYRGPPRPAFHQAAMAMAQRTEGVRMMDMAPTLRSPHRQAPRARLPYYLPRMPLHYSLPQLHPMLAQPHHFSQPGFYLPPEEARMGPLASQLPFYPTHPYFSSQLRGHAAGPYAHYPAAHFNQGAPLHVPHSLSHASPPTANPLGRSTPADDHSDSLSSPESGRSGNTIGMSESGHGFQVLPNVKHVPHHLVRGGLPSSSQNSSRSSTPFTTLNPQDRLLNPQDRLPNPQDRPPNPQDRPPNPQDRPLIPVPPYLQETHAAPVSERPYSPANYGARGSPHSMLEEASRDRSGSRERDTGSKETEVTAQFAGLHTVDSSTGSGSGAKVVNTTTTTTMKKVNNPKKLSLKTGFSRQFSDDLPTPTAILEIVRMIEDNFDDVPEESESPSSSPVGSQRAQLLSRLNGRNAALSSLQLDLKAAQQRQQQQAAPEYGTPQSASSSESPAALNEERSAFTGLGEGLMPDAGHNEPQTPRTPSGFMTPCVGVVDVDPQGILKSLNIGGPGYQWGGLQQSEESLP